MGLPTLPSSVRSVLNFCAWVLVIVPGFLTFIFAMWVAFLAWWFNLVTPTWSIFSYYNKFTANFLYPPAILDIFFVRTVYWTWLPLAVVAVVSIWMRNWPFQPTRDKLGAFDPSLIQRKRGPWQRFKDQVQLLFTYQLPPRKVWSYLLDGGLNVTDLIVITFWMAMNALWLYYAWLAYYPEIEEEFELSKTEDNPGGTRTYGNKWGDYGEALGYASAWAAVFNMVFLFVPLPRSTFLQYLFNSDFSSIIRYHRWLGHGFLFISLLHGMFFWTSWWGVNTKIFRDKTFEWQGSSVNYLAGSISFIPFGLILWITTIPYIRRHFFKLFYICHIVGAFGFLFFLEIHYPGCVWYMPGLALYFMDVTFRLVQWRVTSGIQCTFVSADKSFVTIRLKFNKAARAQTNQFLFLNVPSVSRVQWHPFSIAAVYPGADGISQDVIIHVKAYGTWSRTLCQQLAQHGHLAVRADGPYGSAIEPHWQHNESLIMIAGGIGITPILGILRDIKAKYQVLELNEAKVGDGLNYAGLPREVHVVWAVRKRDELQLLDRDLLDIAGASGSWLKLNLHQTRGQADDYTETASNSSQEADYLKDGIINHSGPTQATNSHGAYKSLQPYCYGDFLFALCHVLALGGCFFSLLMAAAYQYEGLATGVSLGLGYRIEVIAVLMCITFVLGSMGLPALIIFPVHYFGYLRHVKKCQKAHAGNLSAGAGLADGAEKVSEAQVAKLMPRDATKSGPLDLETGKSATVHMGRPNLQRIITGIVSEVHSGQTVSVIASGPNSLVNDARAATHDASRIFHKNGFQGIPELVFSNHSFQL